MDAQIEFYQNKLNYETDPGDLFEALENNENIVVVDTRKPQGFERERIPVAINLPHREMNGQTTANLDKSKLYVCYCDGIGCNASTHGALKLTKLGFKVKELMGGLAWWKKNGFATKGTNATKGKALQCAC